MARFTNQAQLRYGNSIANSNIAVGEILEVLSAEKTAVKAEYTPNDCVTYVISIVNAGTTAMNGLSVTDNLGTYLQAETELTPLRYVEGSVKYYVNGVLQSTPVVVDGPPLVINGINVPAGGDVIIVYEADINEYAPLAAGSQITNTATIAGAGITPITAEEVITAVQAPMLTITKSISPVPVTENGTLTYTFLIQNMGNAQVDETVGAIVTDTFNPILSNPVVTFNGTAWTQTTNYTYDETTGVFATNTGQITVPAATYARDPVTNAVVVTPGVSTLVIAGII